MNATLQSFADVPEMSGLIGDELKHILTIVSYVTLCLGVSLIGLVANSINILVFTRQGFKDTINISLFGMAISDLILHIMTLLLSASRIPGFERTDAAFKLGDALFVLSAWSQVITTRITGWIIAFVTLERCLCIVIPFKIKDILSPALTKGVILSIYLISITFVMPVFFTFRVGWSYDSNQNRSVFAYVPLESKKNVENTVSYLSNVVFPLISFAMVFVNTVLLSISINQAHKWRLKSFAASAESSRTRDTSRDRRVIKMVAVVALSYIVCYTPTIGLALAMTQEPEFHVSGRYRNIFFIYSSLCFFLENVNSGLNIVIYYNMSSKYREIFRSIFIKRQISSDRVSFQ